MSSFEEEDFQYKKRALGPFMKRLFGYSLAYPNLYWQMIISIFVASSAAAATPLIWLNYIDYWITPTVENVKEGLAIDWSSFGFYGALFITVYLLDVIGIGIFIRSAGKLEENVIHDLRNAMFRKLQYLSYSFYDRSPIGHLAIRLTSDVDKVSNVISWSLADLMFGIFMILVSMVMMFYYNWQLALIVLLTVPILLVLSIRVRVMLISYARRARRTYSQMAAYLTEHINGLEVNKTTVQEQRAAQNFQKVTERLRFASYKSAFYSSMYNPIVVITGSIATGLVIYLGGHLALAEAGGITVGILAAFFGYSRLIFEPIFDIARYYATAQDSLSAGERIFSLIDEPLEIYDRSDVDLMPQIKGNITFDQVSFKYATGPYVLQDFSLEVPAGQSLAIVGATGSGKTTISNLICRFYEPTAGAILIDGHDYMEKKLHSFRKQLGIILQTPHLFSGSLRDNLKYGNLSATDEEIIYALETIGANDFIDQLDDPVGEEGRQLSAGEKQLISFARAILKDPRILIMDEATSSIDTLAELKIQKGIPQLIKGRTSIIIAHRLSTIRNCDRILVLSKGKIIEDGHHDELIQLKGHYFTLYTKQARQMTTN